MTKLTESIIETFAIKCLQALRMISIEMRNAR